MTVKMNVDKELGKVNINYSIPNNMSEVYDEYISNILEDGAYIVINNGENLVHDTLVGYIDLEFNETYDYNTNMAFINDIKSNLEMLDKGVVIL